MNFERSTFEIDFFELAFLAEACIPPRPIARAMFWQSLTDKYWHQMSEGQRRHLFQWLQKNSFYKESLETEEDTKVFHARFDPDNQYTVYSTFEGVNKISRAFKLGDRYWINTRTFISEEYITEVEKLELKFEY